MVYSIYRFSHSLSWFRKPIYWWIDDHQPIYSTWAHPHHPHLPSNKTLLWVAQECSSLKLQRVEQPLEIEETYARWYFYIYIYILNFYIFLKITICVYVYIYIYVYICSIYVYIHVLSMSWNIWRYFIIFLSFWGFKKKHMSTGFTLEQAAGCLEVSIVIGALPVIHFRWSVFSMKSLKSTIHFIQLWGYPHDYGNPVDGGPWGFHISIHVERPIIPAIVHGLIKGGVTTKRGGPVDDKK